MTALIAYIIVFYILLAIGFKIIRKNWDILTAMVAGIAAFAAVAHYRKQNRPLKAQRVRMAPPREDAPYERQQTAGSVHFEENPF